MVRHIHDGRDYWTLPGGGIEPGETPEQAAEREVLEETGIAVKILEHIFTSTSKSGQNTSMCFLMSEPDDLEISLGSDPEEAHLRSEERMLQAAEWKDIDGLRDDFMVARIIEHLQNK